MSTTTTPESNGTATGTTAETAGTKNRVRSALAGATKYQRLFAIAGRAAERRSFTVKRTTEEGAVALKLDGGFPTTLDAAGVAKLATQAGAKVSGTVNLGPAVGRWSGVLLGTTAGEMVNEMTSD
jgi:hypothetical protein